MVKNIISSEYSKGTNEIRLKQHSLSRIFDFLPRGLEIERISEFHQSRLIHARYRWREKKRSGLRAWWPLTLSRRAYSWLFVQLRNLDVQTPLLPAGAGLCARPASLKVRHEVSGRGGNTPLDFFFRARYNPCRCEAVIRAAVTRPWSLELHPTDETDYSSYQINLCLLSLAGLCSPSPPPPSPSPFRLAVATLPHSPSVVLGFTRELTQSGHDNANLEKCAFGDTTQQVSTECPDTDLQILRFYRGTRRSSPFVTAADPPVSPLRVFCCRSSLRFYEKGLGANQCARVITNQLPRDRSPWRRWLAFSTKK